MFYYKNLFWSNAALAYIGLCHCSCSPCCVSFCRRPVVYVSVRDTLGTGWYSARSVELRRAQPPSASVPWLSLAPLASLIPFPPVTEKSRKEMPPRAADSSHRWEALPSRSIILGNPALPVGSEPKCVLSLNTLLAAPGGRREETAAGPGSRAPTLPGKLLHLQAQALPSVACLCRVTPGHGDSPGRPRAFSLLTLHPLTLHTAGTAQALKGCPLNT